ncbi:MAG: VCBS repeat-containing protein [Verrucomicrobiota bacterium]
MRPSPSLPLISCWFAVFLGTGQSEISFEAQTIDRQIQVGYGLALGDVDGDKKPDIILADKKEVVWYQNPDWTKRILARNLTIRDNVCLAARDLDGDGQVEIAVGGNWNPGETSNTKTSGSLHYLIRPDDGIEGRWEPVPITPHEPTVHRMHWVRDGDGKYQLVVLPLHGRGNRGGDGPNNVKVLAYLPPEDPREGTWKTTLLDESLHMAHNFDFRPTKKGAETMIIGGKEGMRRVSIPKEGDEAKADWVFEPGKPPLPEGFKGFGESRFLGPEGDFFAQIEPMHGNQLTVYSTDRRVLKSDLAEGHALACGNVLGNSRSRAEIVVGWRKADRQGKVGIELFYRKDYRRAWEHHRIDDNTMACEDLKILDLDDDGKAEIIACGRGTQNVVIYWNKNDS